MNTTLQSIYQEMCDSLPNRYCCFLLLTNNSVEKKFIIKSLLIANNHVIRIRKFLAKHLLFVLNKQKDQNVVTFFKDMAIESKLSFIKWTGKGVQTEATFCQVSRNRDI